MKLTMVSALAYGLPSHNPSSHGLIFRVLRVRNTKEGHDSQNQDRRTRNTIQTKKKASLPWAKSIFCEDTQELDLPTKISPRSILAQNISSQNGLPGLLTIDPINIDQNEPIDIKKKKMYQQTPFL